MFSVGPAPLLSCNHVTLKILFSLSADSYKTLQTQLQELSRKEWKTYLQVTDIQTLLSFSFNDTS
jgi:2'-5' RNA ligase